MAVASDLRYDVAVIGGGAAGLSGALALARATRSVVVVDAGSPRNAAAEGIHGFLTRDGMSPSEFIVAGRREVTGYGAQILERTVTSVQRSSDGFVCVSRTARLCMPASSSSALGWSMSSRRWED
jgi:thioredoxin reductase